MLFRSAFPHRLSPRLENRLTLNRGLFRGARHKEFRDSDFVNIGEAQNFGEFTSTVIIDVVNSGRTPAHSAEIWVTALDTEDISQAL